jgi:hypothetical protein
MPTRKEEARLAFELWNKICQLESVLWAIYDKEFMALIMAEEDSKSENPLLHGEDSFPF